MSVPLFFVASYSLVGCLHSSYTADALLPLQIGDLRDVVQMSEEGVSGCYVNPHGVVHDIHTLGKVRAYSVQYTGYCMQCTATPCSTRRGVLGGLCGEGRGGVQRAYFSTDSSGNRVGKPGGR